MKIPNSLRTWFKIHFVIDYIVAIPLFLFPSFMLSWFLLDALDPILARVVAAALFAIGGVSLLHSKGSKEFYKAMLDLKIIWSSFAIIALYIGIRQGYNLTLWFFIFIFLVFDIVWIYYRKRYF
tara:strand:- start:2890 stop:3261 length:372 start_codon:yes stop_codon:yes gene_type:complete